MNSTLFTMHNIKYIISVDDCYFAPKRETSESVLYAEMRSSMCTFREKLISLGKASKLDEYDDLTSLGADSDSLVRDLIHSLTDGEIIDLLSIIDSGKYHNEEDGILAFLSELQAKGCVDRYYTCGSTEEAMQLDCVKEGMADGNILWLLDRNFERVGESPDAGIQLAQNIVQRRTEQINYVYVLSAVEKDSDKNEDDIELEFDEVLSRLCAPEAMSFVYYINKQRVLAKDDKKIEKSLAQGFKRKVCFELFQIYKDCLCISVDKSAKTISEIKQKTINYLFGQKAAKEGESRFDLLTRLVQIFQTDEYNCELANKHEAIANKLFYFDDLCTKVKDGIGDVTQEMTPILKKFREIELYNKYINTQHSELSTGDIFKVRDEYYILVSQSCDTYLRPDGKRKLDSACLLQIADKTDPTKYKCNLSCFLDFKKPLVAYQSQIALPFDVLDLCVTDSEGHAQIPVQSLLEKKDLDMRIYTKNFANRYTILTAHIKRVYMFRNALERYIDKDTDVSSEDAKKAFRILLDEEAFLKKYSIDDGILHYPIQRICRLDELTTVEIIRDYVATLSRIGQPFDFTTA